jgi:ferrochelatase
VSDAAYDAVIVVSFGGPEGPADVEPFLDNVLRGRAVPPARRAAVVEHYLRFGGRSPLNDQNRALIAALEGELARAGLALPVYFGNRNWHPLLPDTLRVMRDAGVRRALAYVTSAFGSYSGCRQYRENIAAAIAAVGSGAPAIEKLRLFWNHPRFLEASADGVRAALARLPERSEVMLVFSAHSIPTAMAASAPYEAQLREASALVAADVGGLPWRLAFQSRSGPPSQPWLEPDVGALLGRLAADGVRAVVVVPIGFVSDHMEVVHDLDIEAAARARDLGLGFERAATAGCHPAMVAMVRELIEERVRGVGARWRGESGVWPEGCRGEGCCVVTAR